MHRRQVYSELNATNLVDVSLTLLILFIISAPLLKTSIDVALPKTTAAKFSEKEGLAVTITKDKEIFIEKTKVTPDVFVDKFKTIFAAKAPNVVYLQADAGVPYGFVVDILGKIKLAGVENVGLTVDLKEKK